MANYSNLKSAINSNITTNGNEEITGAILNGVLQAMVTALGAGYQYMGTVTPDSESVGTPDYRVFYLATAPGTYSNFGGTVVTEPTIFYYDTGWNVQVLSGSFTSVNNVLAMLGYYECPTASGTAAKTITATDYVLKTGGAMKVKFANKNTSNGSVTLNINSTGAKPLYYQGALVNAYNTWEADEVCDVYYDGTKYYANPVIQQDEIFDISAYNNNATYTDLANALGTNAVNIPVNKRKPGMTIKFMLASGDYLQYRYTKSELSNSVMATPSNYVNYLDDKFVKIYGIIGMSDYYDFTNIVSEIYLDKRYLVYNNNSCEYVAIRKYSSNLYIRNIIGGSGSSYLWNYSIAYSGLQNNVVYPIINNGTHAADGVASNTIVGYVVFKNIEAALNLNTGYQIINVNVDNAKQLSLCPQICAYLSVPADNSITTPMIADGAVTANKLNVNNTTIFEQTLTGYQNDVAELYLVEPALVGVNWVNLRSYQNDVLLRGYSSVYPSMTAIAWTARYTISSWENGKVYELKCTTAGDSSTIALDDVVGYIVFKNISHFKTTHPSGSTGTYDLININRASMLWLQPFIETYITTANDIPDGSITTEKLSDSTKAIMYGNGVEIVVPDEIPVVVNNKIRLYWRSIIKCPNPYIYDVYAVSSKGKSLPRYYEFVDDTVETVSVTVYVKNPQGLIIAQKTFSIKSVAAMSAPSDQLNILVMGASATASGYIAGELKRRLTTNTGDGISQNPTGLNLNNISFVGRKTGASVPTVNQEATGGWSWLDYAGQGRPAYRFNVTGITQLNINDTYTQGDLTFTIVEINITEGGGNIRCLYAGTGTITESGTLTRASGSGDATITYISYDTESYNPFWNQDKAGGAGLDFINYAHEYCNDSIGMIISHCGLNDIRRYTESNISNLFTDYVKPFVRAFHTDFPNAKFVFSTLPLGSPNGGMGANYGASAIWNYYNLVKLLFAFSKAAWAMAAENEFSTYFSIADDVPSFDCENLYPTTNTDKCLRLNATEILQSNGVHPIMEGSYTVSDAIYNHINSLF